MELLHKLREEARYDGLDQLAAAIAGDVAEACAWFAAQRRVGDAAAVGRQATRDRT